MVFRDRGDLLHAGEGFGRYWGLPAIRQTRCCAKQIGGGQWQMDSPAQRSSVCVPLPTPAEQYQPLRLQSQFGWDPALGGKPPSK